MALQLKLNIRQHLYAIYDTEVRNYITDWMSENDIVEYIKQNDLKDLTLYITKDGNNLQKDPPKTNLPARIKCLKCGAVIQSTHRHDFVMCTCKSCYVDGGNDPYVRYGGDFDKIMIINPDGTEELLSDQIARLQHKQEQGK